ncbi:MAG: hypothetical protein HWE26_13205 [Alteromonadaceae bacterium]|nr:hypothetical protein [Alteromonadaceae bacterium]
MLSLGILFNIILLIVILAVPVVIFIMAKDVKETLQMVHITRLEIKKINNKINSLEKALTDKTAS